jgi:hypothetical protein
MFTGLSGCCPGPAIAEGVTQPGNQLRSRLPRSSIGEG